jgi:hypothetical protein
MGIRFRCPQCGKKIHVKDFLAGKRGICPKCDYGVDIPLVSQLPPSLKKKSRNRGKDDGANRGPAKVAAAAERAPAGRLLGTSELPTIDPLVESPARRWFVGSPDGRDVGPLAAGEVRGMIDVGDIGAESSVRREDWPERLVAAAVWPNWKGADPFAVPQNAVPQNAAPQNAAPQMAVPPAAGHPASGDERLDDGDAIQQSEPREPAALKPIGPTAPAMCPPHSLPVAVDSPTEYLPPTVGNALISSPASPPWSPPAVPRPAPESALPDDSAAPRPEIYYGSNASYLAAIVILIVVVAVLAVAAYRVVFDPPAWLRPQPTGAQSADRSFAAVMPLFSQRNYP